MLEALRRVFYAESGDPIASATAGVGFTPRPSVISVGADENVADGEAHDAIAATCELRAPSPEASASRKASAASSVSGRNFCSFKQPSDNLFKQVVYSEIIEILHN